MSAVQTLGKHEIRRQLGRGAMGIVYEGWDPVIKRQVAIKTVRLPEATDTETADEIARFRREAEAAGRLNHPNIVGVFDYGETDDLAYIVMEFVDGPTLKALLDKNERFPLPRIVQIMEDLLAGLQFSHERGVVHRDIKPANLMLTTSGQAKIADFGIARIESSSMTQAGTVLGTPAYMSPEQFMGQVVDARSDIYSSGVLLYQLLTGERPFEGGMSSIMHKALNVEPPAPSQISVTVPRQFDAVVRKAMAKRPDDRFSSAQEFASAIQAAIAAPAPIPKAEPHDAGGDATIVAAPGSRLPAPRPAPGRAAAPLPAPAAAGIVASATPPPSAVPTRDHATAGAKTSFPAAGVIGAGIAGLAVLGGIGYFLLAGNSTTPSPPRELAGPPVVAAPQATPPPTIAPAADPSQSRAVALSEPVTPPPAGQPAMPPPPAVALAPPRETPPPAGPAPVVAPPVVAPPVVAPPVVAPPVVAPSANTALPADATPPVSAPSPPIPSPAAAVPTQVALSPLDQARETARSVPCSALNVTSEPDGLRISGLAHAGPELDRLLTNARGLGGLTDDVTRAERFTCAPIEIVATFARQSWESAPRTFAVSVEHREPVSGTPIGLGFTTLSPVLYVDLYQGDGLVHHLWRPSSTGTEPVPREIAANAPAPGPGLIVAIGAATPLALGSRPETEKAAEYLAILQPQLYNSMTPPAADLAMVTIRPMEPAAPRPRPPEPAVAKSKPVEPPATRARPIEPAEAKAPPRQPALHSARCSNIVSRAQLGETLSNADLTALRTECRS
jgi:tRNA A-37 threonylcarbamoyl transferase component Bud32